MIRYLSNDEEKSYRLRANFIEENYFDWTVDVMHRKLLEYYILAASPLCFPVMNWFMVHLNIKIVRERLTR